MAQLSINVERRTRAISHLSDAAPHHLHSRAMWWHPPPRARDRDHQCLRRTKSALHHLNGDSQTLKRRDECGLLLFLMCTCFNDPIFLLGPVLNGHSGYRPAFATDGRKPISGEADRNEAYSAPRTGRRNPHEATPKTAQQCGGVKIRIPVTALRQEQRPGGQLISPGFLRRTLDAESGMRGRVDRSTMGRPTEASSRRVLRGGSRAILR